jgi:DNA repair protein RadD
MENLGMNSSDKTWLTLDEAAAHLGLGKTVLYSMAREGRIPASKVTQKWVFEKTSLDAWMRASQPLETFFLKADANIDGNDSLREPQRDAYTQVQDFFAAGKNNALVQIPVGCGKTGLVSILPFGLSAGRVLVIAPNLQIKKELFDAMDVTNRRKCFWRRTNILNDNQMALGPIACTLDSGNLSTAEKSHIVISNVQQLATDTEKWLDQFDARFFAMIVVDEAHHSAAQSWRNVIARFKDAKVVLLTATPFRSDRQKLEGELVYRYPFRSATMRGYIKRLRASYVAPAEVELAFTDKAGTKYSLEEVLKMKEDEWFSRSIALSPVCNKHIVDSSLAKLEELRQTGTQHQLVAVACHIEHAKAVSSLYRERGFTAEVLHSKMSPKAQDEVLAQLKNGTLDCIVQVQMLGEGFDHPKLSVAAIFRPYRSLAPYIQFVGRIMRVVVQNDATHPDNIGHIVTHLGMNLDARLNEFKEFERDDQAFWDRVIRGEDPEVPPEVQSGDTRLRATDAGPVVRGEIVDSLWEEDFTSPEDQQVLDDLKKRMELLGLDPAAADELMAKSKREPMRKKAPVEGFLVLPQRKLVETRKRLNEKSHHLAKILLNQIGVGMKGLELPYKYTSLGVNGADNFTCALIMVNTAIGKRLGKPRSLASTEELEAVLGDLDSILEPLSRQLRKVKADHDRANP